VAGRIVSDSINLSVSFACLHDWFNSNLLTLNFNKTKHVQFEAKSSCNDILVSYQNNAIVSTTKAKFFVIVMESSCTWKSHIVQLCLNYARPVL
jgi:hypothetical protein